MRSLTVGQQVVAKDHRFLEFEGHNPIVLWNRGDVLTIGGIIQHSPGHLDCLIELEAGDWENVPMVDMEDFFESLPASGP